MRSLLLLGFLFSLVSCDVKKSTTSSPKEESPPPSEKTLPPPSEKTTYRSLYSSPLLFLPFPPIIMGITASGSRRQKTCSGRRVNDRCEGSRSCKNICNDIFLRKSDRQDCYALSEDVVFEFKTVIDNTKAGKVKEIDSAVLECMLRIDEREFVRAVGKMSRREARNFLFEITKNKYLAGVLEEEDDEFNILKELLSRAVGTGLQTVLTEKIKDDKSFFWLATENNERAWDYLDDYVSERCKSRNSDCPQGDNIGAYCKALVTGSDSLNRNDLRDFLSSADLFAEHYEVEVEEEGYEYDVDNNSRARFGDFRIYCRDVVAGLLYR